ncbi:hypothetical protein H5410_027338 [Solanum commersonii]|uniref:Uncharacterized protein n=1 Tax=Solanum commersonii TaxID=4109 RepID=A0A9J5Z462_SOLCO|nr:hypothetical protein H5410_027338 [Solanum commersonii]
MGTKFHPKGINGIPYNYLGKTTTEKIGKKLGKFLKIDSCTSVTLQGRYARICVQVPLGQPL